MVNYSVIFRIQYYTLYVDRCNYGYNEYGDYGDENMDTDETIASN